MQISQTLYNPQKTNWQRIYAVLLALLSSVSLCLDLTEKTNKQLFSAIPFNHPIARLIADFRLSLHGDGIKNLFLAILLIVVFVYVLPVQDKRTRRVTLWPSGLMAMFMVIGISFSKTNSLDLIYGSLRAVVKSFVSFTGYFALFYVVISILFRLALQIDFEKAFGGKRCIFGYDKRSFFALWGIIFACWLVYIIIFYPGNSDPDVSHQLRQAFGLQDYFYTRIEKPISDTVFLNDHHPVMHTWLLGLFAKGGEALFGSQTVGIFCYTLIQVFATSATFSFTICYLAKLKLPYVLRVGALGLVSFVPVFPLSIINIAKNSWYSYVVLLFSIAILELILRTEQTIKSKFWMILLIASMTATMFSIKYGIYVVFVSFLFIIAVFRKYWKKLLPAFILPIIVFQILFTSVLLPVLGISSGAKAEMFSIPFQQTARFVRDHPDEVTDEEREVLDKVFIYEKLSEKYNPILVDPIKWQAYRTHTAPEHFKEYFKVWFAQFLRHPETYLTATLNTCYGYFYLDQKDWKFYLNFDTTRWKDTNGLINAKQPESLEKARLTVLEAVYHTGNNMPILGMLMKGSTYVWILILSFFLILLTKKKRYLIAMIPTIVNLLFCVLSPRNANFRYTMPIMYASVLILGISLLAVREYQNSKKTNAQDSSNSEKISET